MDFSDVHYDGFKNQILLMSPNSLINELENHPAYSQLYLIDIGFYPNAAGHFCSRPNGAEYNIIIYNTNGTGFSRVGSGEYNIPPGHFIILPAFVPHIYGSNEGWSIYWAHFKGEQSNKLLSEFEIVYGKPYPISTKQEEVTSLFKDIFSTLQMGFSLQNTAYASMTLWHIIASFLFRNRVINNNKEPDPVEESIKYMQQNLCKNLSLEDLANVAGYSPSYYSASFREKTGSAPITYFIGLKMHLAAQYLHETGKPVKEIAYILGYASQYYFSRLFKIHIGTSPLQYRRTRSTR